MLVMRKKEIVAGALVVLIGVAGYLNWSYQDTVRVTDGDEYIQMGKKLGEAQYVNADTQAVDVSAKVRDEEASNKSAGEYFAMAKAEKESSRSKSLEILNKTAENESFDEQTRQNAQQKILDIAQNAQKEAIIESVAEAKGYENISVYIDTNTADIIVQKDNFSQDDVNVLTQIVSEQTDIAPSNIKIVERKQ